MSLIASATVRKIPEAEWENQKATLAVLYQAKSLKNIISYMAEHHAFHASKAQYVRQFDRWGLQKNAKKTDWKAINRAIEKRKAAGKTQTQVLVNGSLVCMKKLRKELSRHCLPTYGARSPTPELSTDVVVSTPAVVLIDEPVDCFRIPWLEFETLAAPFLRDLVKATYDALAPRADHSSSSSTADGLIPWPTDALIHGDEETPRETSANQMQVGGQSQKPSTSQHHAHRLAFLPTTDDSAGFATSQAVRELEDAQIASKVQACVQIFKVLIYEASNSILSLERGITMIKWVRHAKVVWLLNRLLALKTPTTYRFGEFVLVCAVSVSDIGIVRVALDHGVNMDATVSAAFGITNAISESLRTANLALLQNLLQEGADPSKITPWIHLPTGSHRYQYSRAVAMEFISHLIRHHHLDKLHLHTDDLLFSLPLYLEFVLSGAATDGDHELAKAILDTGLHPDATMAGRGTALQIAASSGQLSVVRLLIDRGAALDFPATIDGFRSPLYGCQFSACFYSTPLEHAAASEREIIVRMLLGAGADPNASIWKDSSAKPVLFHRLGQEFQSCQSLRNCRTALQATVDLDSTTIVTLLLMAGADPNITVDGLTSLHRAVIYGSQEIVERLLRYGADPHFIGKNSDVVSPFKLGIKTGDLSVLLPLANAGLSPDASGCFNLEPNALSTLQASECLAVALQNAVTVGDLHTTRGLLAAGVDVNATPWPFGGRTALQAALQRLPRTKRQRAEDEMDNTSEDGAECSSEDAMGAMGPASPTTMPASQVVLTGSKTSTVKEEFIFRLHGISQLQSGTIEAGGPETPFNSLKIVKLLLKAGANANANPGPNGGRTALQSAAETGKLRAAEVLLGAGADVNAIPAEIGGITALRAATQLDSPEILDLLLRWGADPNEPPSGTPPVTALQASAAKGSLEMIERLLEAGANVNRPLSAPGELTPLQHACSKRQEPAVKLLLRRGAEINTVSLEDPAHSALSIAFASSYPQGQAHPQVSLLLQHGADPNGAPHGYPPLVLAATWGQPLWVDELLQAGAHPNANHPGTHLSALDIAVRLGWFENLDRLLAAGANPAGAMGISVATAVRRGCKCMLELLLSGGACPNPFEELPGPSEHELPECSATAVGSKPVYLGVDGVMDKWKFCGQCHDPLRRAAAMGRPDMMRLLLQAGARDSVEPKAWGTALQAAARMGGLEATKLLINHGAHVNVGPGINAGGRTAIQAAVDSCNVELVEYLLEQGADVNGPPATDLGISALGAAAARGHLRIALILLRAGARINGAVAETGGRSALQAAAEHGRLDMVHLLVRNDCDEGLSARCQDAAAFAEKEGHTYIADFLRGYEHEQ